jgi:hypothetical protein
MTKLEQQAQYLLRELNSFEQKVKLATEAADDNTKLFMAQMCARKATLEMDSCVRYLRDSAIIKRPVGRR